MQRIFEPMRKQNETWQRSELTDVTAKVVIYGAFVEGKLEAPKHLVRTVHDLYFEPKYEEFRARTTIPGKPAVAMMPYCTISRSMSLPRPFPHRGFREGRASQSEAFP